MSKKKTQRWRSRPKDTGERTYSRYRKPDTAEETYHIRREDAPQAPSALEQRYREEKKQQQKPVPRKKKGKQKRKYQSAPAPVRSDDMQTEQRRAQRAKHRHAKNMFFRVMVACVFFVVVVVVCVFVFFKIGKIKVEGSEKYTAAQVIEASGAELGDNLYVPTAASIQENLDKKLPYIYAVTLKHELPDTLVICVKETQAAYAFKSSNQKQTRYLLTDS